MQDAVTVAPPLTQEQGELFAKEWISAWNSHNIEDIMSHYSDTIAFTSPFAIAILKEPKGQIQGKATLRSYFTSALERYPDLKFELYQVLVGVNSVVLYYKSVKGLYAAETMVLSERTGTPEEQGNIKLFKVQQVFAHYSPTKPVGL